MRCLWRPNRSIYPINPFVNRDWSTIHTRLPVPKVMPAQVYSMATALEDDTSGWWSGMFLSCILYSEHGKDGMMDHFAYLVSLRI